MTTTLTTRLAGCLLLASGTLLVGCAGRSVSAENDRLRRDRHDLTQRVTLLEKEREELKAKLAEESRARSGALPAEALEAIPRCVALDIGAFSGLFPPDASSPASEIIAYLNPTDSRGRFVQIVGTLNVEAHTLPEPDAPAQSSRVTLTPAMVREAYRSGFTGTHYEIRLPLERPIARSASRSPSVLIRATLADPLAGRELNAERLISRSSGE